MLAELAAASSHGLDAADYDVDWLDGEAKAIAPTIALVLATSSCPGSAAFTAASSSKP
jgi:hypothetical protein